MITAQSIEDFIENDDSLSCDSYIDERLREEAYNGKRFGLTSGWIRVYVDDQNTADEVAEILRDRGFTNISYDGDYVLSCDIQFSWG